MYCAIFDLDGVLVDSYQAHFRSWRDVAAEEGVDLTEAEFARNFGRTSREIIRTTWPAPVTKEGITSIDNRKEEAFRRIISHDFPLMDGARKLISQLRADGFRVAVGSSAPPENVDLALDKLGRHLFDGVVNGMDVQRGKPDPQVFLLAAEHAGVQPRDCVVIEDARPGVEAAHRAGMACVAFVSTGRSEDDFTPVSPELIVRSLGELTPKILRDLIEHRGRA